MIRPKRSKEQKSYRIHPLDWVQTLTFFHQTEHDPNNLA